MSGAAIAAQPEQSLVARLGWFAVGGALSVALNWTLYALVHRQFGHPRWMALAISLSLVTVAFSGWNYFVNFRTGRPFHSATARYLAVVALAWVANYTLMLLGIREFGRTIALEFLVLAAVQVLISGAKFLLYHWWVYPRQRSLGT
jgi:putative flippase GtrA